MPLAAQGFRTSDESLDSSRTVTSQRRTDFFCTPAALRSLFKDMGRRVISQYCPIRVYDENKVDVSSILFL